MKVSAIALLISLIFGAFFYFAYQNELKQKTRTVSLAQKPNLNQDTTQEKPMPVVPEVPKINDIPEVHTLPKAPTRPFPKLEQQHKILLHDPSSTAKSFTDNESFEGPLKASPQRIEDAILTQKAKADEGLQGGDILLTDIKGEVLVNTSGNYQITRTATKILSDTKILLRQNAMARLIFPKGCELKLSGGKIYQAGTESDCMQGVTHMIAHNETKVMMDKPNALNPPQAVNQSPNYLMLGGISALIIGGIAARVHYIDDRQNSNASP